jgi:hypothetical protein
VNFTTQKPNETTPSTELTPAYQDMDRRDENQILSEMRGEILEDLVYDITISGRRVVNLSYAGIKEAIRRRGSLEIIDFKTEETESTIRALVKVRDLQNRIDVLGASEADKSKPFAYTLAVNKAERNAFSKLIPAKWLATMVDDFIQQKGTAPRREQPPRQIQVPKKPVNPVKLDPENLTFLTATTEMKKEGLKQYALVDGLNPIGMINVYGEFIGLVPENANLRRDHTAFTSFLFPRVLDQMTNKYRIEYDDVGTENGELLYIVIKGKLADEQIKELQSAVKWAFQKASGQNGTKQPGTT